jgi:hypothetical protein
LEHSSDLGFRGAAAIREALKVRKIDLFPSVRTMRWQTSGHRVTVEIIYPNMNVNTDAVKG